MLCTKCGRIRVTRECVLIWLDEHALAIELASLKASRIHSARGQSKLAGTVHQIVLERAIVLASIGPAVLHCSGRVLATCDTGMGEGVRFPE